MLKNQIDLLLQEAEAAYHKQLNIVKEFLGHHHPKDPRHQKVRQVLIAFINNQKFIIMDPLSLQTGNQAPINEALVDAGTLAPIPGATKVNKVRSSDTPAVATVDADGNLVAVAVGTGNLTDTNTWTYIDQNTKQSVTEDLTTVQPFQVIATPEGVLQVVSLGAAVAIPAAAQA